MVTARVVGRGCILMAVCAGCGGGAEPVTGEEISPIQLTEADPAGPPARTETSVMYEPVPPPEMEQAAPVVTAAMRSKPREEVLQMTAMDLSQPRRQQAQPTPQAAPAKQPAAALPTEPPQAAPPEPAPPAR